MQDEFDAMDELPVQIKIIGLNAIDRSTRDSFLEDRDLPWLQDTEQERVWQQWNIQYRDLLILDTENRSVAVFNLTSTNLSTDDYETVKAEFLAHTNED